MHTFWVILLTDRQTDGQKWATRAKIITSSFVGGNNRMSAKELNSIMPDFFQSMIPIIILLFGHWTGESKMEFDAHMRLHFDHRCPFCDYSSRTEGRLRCHIKTFHADGGLCSAAPTTDQAAKRKPKIITCQKCGFKAKEKVRIVEIWQSSWSCYHLRSRKAGVCVMSRNANRKSYTVIVFQVVVFV